MEVKLRRQNWIQLFEMSEQPFTVEEVTNLYSSERYTK